MDKRMAGDYEVIHAFHIGDKEIVIGENIEADDDERYMCAFCEKNEIMERYTDVIASDDFCEVAKLYADRLSEQAEKRDKPPSHRSFKVSTPLHLPKQTVL